MSENKGMPTYVVLDTSKSMAEHESLLNRTLGNILNKLFTSPRFAEFIQLSILTFSAQPNLVLKMTELQNLRHMPTVRCGGSTRFAPMFEMLRARVEHDLPMLRRQGVTVMRPVVFLLTDGAPSDRPDGAWEAAHKRLVDPAWKPHPHIISYGFGDAVESILRRMSTLQTYLATGELADAGEALDEAMSAMLNSMVASAAAQELRIPENVRGYRSIPEEYVEH
ncbi:hypothetical protein GCM10010191_53170 [Actinomadura vinacea]|uniref:VWFA domain-containing protein n=1 Tax=Actinomadura vinacea TaxID=115336 RepID=A0ABN3JML8_9ACTN